MVYSIKNYGQKIIKRFTERGAILMYHRVADVDSDPWGLCVSPKNFEAHLIVLKKLGFSFPSLKKVQRPAGLGAKNKNIIVTFDDGYVDNYLNAKPILERYSIPATFFIVSGAVGRREEFWWDHLERLVVPGNNLPSRIQLTVKGMTFVWLTAQISSNEQEPHALYFAIWEILNPLLPDERSTALKQLAAQLKNDLPARGDYLPVNQLQLQSLGRSELFEIGAHTVHHLPLAYLSIEEQKKEILGSKQDLEAMTGKRVQSFSCPHGSYSDETVRLLKESGFSLGCTSIQENVQGRNNRYLLPRRVVRNWDAQEFERNLKQWLS